MARLLQENRSRIEELRGGATVYRTVYRFEDLGEDALIDRRSQRDPRKVSAEVERASQEDAVDLDLNPRIGTTHMRRGKRLVVLDNFIIHKSRRTLRFLAGLGDRVVLHFLPPYSPRSNVIERLWKQMHGHVTLNHTHRAIDSLMQAVHHFLRDVRPFPGTQVSLMARAA